MAGIALTALLAAAAQSEAPRELPIGSAVLGGWQLAAVTIVGEQDGRPVIGDKRCTIRRTGLELIIPLEQPIAFRLAGPGTGFAEADIAAIALDDRVYAARIVSDHRLSRYRDVDYPPAQVQIPVPEPVVTLGVQGAPGQPFLHVASLLNEMLAARRLTLRYRRAGGNEGRFEIPLTGFGRALSWCQTAFASDRARRLHRR
jgi:hypothetical protein